MPQKIPAPQGGIYALTKNVPSPFHAEPTQTDNLQFNASHSCQIAAFAFAVNGQIGMT